MSAIKVSRARIRAGVWEAVLSMEAETPQKPKLIITHLETPLGDAELTEVLTSPGSWTARFPIPAETLSDGVQSFLVVDTTSGEKIADFTIVAGEPVADTLQAEITLLRAELDMLKHAFRRHCVETM